MIEEKVEIEKSILFDDSFDQIWKAVLASHKKKPTVNSLKMMKNLTVLMSYVSGIENDNFVMKEILKGYRNELRERNTEDKVL